ncbi:TetR/AcrR family transcriptional regulator [Paraburkholderia sp. BCC1886]|uniref:acrylate utilization transcriptional regulator AcuR n=1 Tax=Paraburkholderia sp. BCC1886 TaxID=2562670 RepID=UPI00118394C6|nr:TetR/AcrR family transcriptional regulator [Paraburkholderia sp. BCC1886]
MDTPLTLRRRGRPPKELNGYSDSREALLRAGVAMLTEKGFAATALEDILREASVPKGSFYHYFGSKEAFGLELIEHYSGFFASKLNRFLRNPSRAPLQRIQDFVDDADRGMRRYDYRRGCLIGNLGQEMSALPESYRGRLNNVFADWQDRLAECLQLAQQNRTLPATADCAQLAEFFWTGWEGAVLRARLARSGAPLQTFAGGFFRLLET